MARSIAALIAGMIATFVVVLGVELVGLRVFPQPAAMDPLNPDSVRQHLSEIHVGSFIVVILAWALAAFTGPQVARRIAGPGTSWPALAVITLFAVMCAYNLVVVPSPRWMIPAAVIFVGTASLLGFRTRVPGTQQS